MKLACALLTAALLLTGTSLARANDNAYDAGYEWAQENDYTEADDCGTDDNPFNDGCEAWGDEYQDGYKDAEDNKYTDEDDCSGTDAEEAGCAAYIIDNK